jgi:tetratricopeptide (TPR) repeat protein
VRVRANIARSRVYGRLRGGGSRAFKAASTAGFVLLWALSTASSALASSQSDKKWHDTQKAGSEALDANQFWIAEPLLKQALEQADSEFDETDLRLSKSLGEIGRLHTIRGRFAEAEPYLEKELMVKQRALGLNNADTIPAMGSLIKFYLQYGNKGKAEPLTERMLDFLDGKMQEPLEEPTKVKAEKGQPLQAWAGSAAPVMRNPVLEWAITCDSVGSLYRDRGNLAMADRLFKAALDLKATVYGKDHLSLANSYDNLGTICAAKNEDTDAESYFRDSLATAEKTLPLESHEVFSRLDKLAQCLAKAGKYREAEELYVRAQSFWKHAPSRSGDEARALFALGCLYVDQKRYSEAAAPLAQALHLAERFNGPSSIALVPYLQKYAYTLYHLGRKPEVDQLVARASTISGGKH